MAPVELLQQDHTRQLVRERERAEREAMINVLELQAEGAPDHEAQILATASAPLQKSAEGDGVHGLAVAMQQRREAAPRYPPEGLLVLTDLDHLEPRIPPEQLLVVLDIVDERRAQSPHGDHDYPHDGILGPWTTQARP